MFVLLITIVSLSGCRRATQTPSQSAFKANFSLNAVVEDNKQLFLEEARHSCGAENGNQEPFIQSHEEMTIQIAPKNAPEFMAAIRSNIEKLLGDSNARILDSESESSDIKLFSFSYSKNEIHGSIHVWGISGEGTKFTIIVLITEG